LRTKRLPIPGPLFQVLLTTSIFLSGRISVLVAGKENISFIFNRAPTDTPHWLIPLADEIDLPDAAGRFLFNQGRSKPFGLPSYLVWGGGGGTGVGNTDLLCFLGCEGLVESLSPTV
jgi:hypothetical protein